ncbi:putative RNA binding protein [Xenorhabdus poinarii G6]|uniref:Putative RNA binding protein n=2 Tax=Xenorhabdus poinarii TaxID=40577 RepID=A0A068R735_9GAMM|nr:putative RNA binding protein [Xenorhabdus poinarii G6]
MLSYQITPHFYGDRYEMAVEYVVFNPNVSKKTMTLNKKQVQHLKSLAHSLKPVVMIGNNGLTEGVLAEIEQTLSHHELIKVKVAGEDREIKTLIAEAIVRETGAHNVQIIGKMLVLYRPSEERKISLPK